MWRCTFNQKSFWADFYEILKCGSDITPENSRLDNSRIFRLSPVIFEWLHASGVFQLGLSLVFSVLYALWCSVRTIKSWWGVHSVVCSKEIQTAYNSNIKTRLDVQICVNDFYAQKAFDVYRGFIQLFTIKRRQPRKPPTPPIGLDVAIPVLFRQEVKSRSFLIPSFFTHSLILSFVL